MKSKPIQCRFTTCKWFVWKRPQLKFFNIFAICIYYKHKSMLIDWKAVPPNCCSPCQKWKTEITNHGKTSSSMLFSSNMNSKRIRVSWCEKQVFKLAIKSRTISIKWESTFKVNFEGGGCLRFCKVKYFTYFSTLQDKFIAKVSA